MTPHWKKRTATPMRHGDPDVAIAVYLEELRHAEVAGAPTPAAALNGLGDAHLDKGEIVSAIDYYRQAAEVYEREGMHDNAIACCKKIRRYAPEDEEVSRMLGRYYTAKGLRADAVRELEVYADRHVETGRQREMIELLREIVRLDPDRTGRREQLARRLADEGRRDEAITEYRALLARYRVDGDLTGVERVQSAATALEAAAAPESEAPAAPERQGATASQPRAMVASMAEPAAPPTPPPSIEGLELEPTSYEEPRASASDASPLPEALSDVQATVPGSPDEAVAAAETHAAAGRLELAARDLAAAALGFRAAGRWREAVAAYRRLAQLDQASAEDFDAWAECARQAGEAPKVIEALAASARWHLARDDRPAAQRAAEEMLLLDPNSAIASDILEQVGTSFPPR